MLAVGLGMGLSMPPPPKPSPVRCDVTREFGTALGGALLGALLSAGNRSVLAYHDPRGADRRGMTDGRDRERTGSRPDMAH
jgi:hypothetical protein